MKRYKIMDYNEPCMSKHPYGEWLNRIEVIRLMDEEIERWKSNKNTEYANGVYNGLIIIKNLIEEED